MLPFELWVITDSSGAHFAPFDFGHRIANVTEYVVLASPMNGRVCESRTDGFSEYDHDPLYGVSFVRVSEPPPLTSHGYVTESSAPVLRRKLRSADHVVPV